MYKTKERKLRAEILWMMMEINYECANERKGKNEN